MEGDGLACEEIKRWVLGGSCVVRLVPNLCGGQERVRDITEERCKLEQAYIWMRCVDCNWAFVVAEGKSAIWANRHFAFSALGTCIGRVLFRWLEQGRDAVLPINVRLLEQHRPPHLADYVCWLFAALARGV